MKTTLTKTKKSSKKTIDEIAKMNANKILQEARRNGFGQQKQTSFKFQPSSASASTSSSSFKLNNTVRSSLAAGLPESRFEPPSKKRHSGNDATLSSWKSMSPRKGNAVTSSLELGLPGSRFPVSNHNNHNNHTNVITSQQRNTIAYHGQQSSATLGRCREDLERCNAERTASGERERLCRAHAHDLSQKVAKSDKDSLEFKRLHDIVRRLRPDLLSPPRRSSNIPRSAVRPQPPRRKAAWRGGARSSIAT